MLVKFCNPFSKIGVYLTASFSIATGFNPRGGKSGQHRATCHLKGWVWKQECFCNRKCHRKQGSHEVECKLLLQGDSENVR